MNRIETGGFWLFWLLALMGQAQPYEPVRIGSTRDSGGELSLQNRLYQFIDSTGSLSIQDIIARQRAGRFQAGGSLTQRQDFGYNTTPVCWLFFELSAPASTTSASGESGNVTRLMLEIEYANLDDLELLEVSKNRIRSLGRTGDRFLFAQRPYLNNNYVFPISLAAGQTARYYLRLNQPHAILSFFVRLWHRPAFVFSDRNEYFLWGIFIGVVCIILVINLVMLAILRDRIYIWYSLYLHFITMHLFSDAGLGFQYLWPTLPRLNEYLPVYLYVWAGMVAQLRFMHYFIGQHSQNSRLFRWIQGFRWLVMSALIVVVVVQTLDIAGREPYQYRLVSLATSCFALTLVVLTMLSLYERATYGDRDKMVRYYTYALIIQLIGYSLVGFLNYAQQRGWALPFDVETYVVLSLTVVTDMIVFAYGLTYRYTRARQQNQALELHLIQTRQTAQQQIIRSLEDERQRLAQDLHDDVGPLLATAKGLLSRLTRQRTITPLQRAQTLLDEAADELRTLSHQLLPKHLGSMNLADAIAETAHKQSGHRVLVHFMSLGTVQPLDSQREQLLFSIATQLIRTARQHPNVTDVTVQLLYHNDQINLSVEDDGQPTPLPLTEAANLRAKVNLLRADLLIDATETGNSIMVNMLLPKPIPT